MNKSRLIIFVTVLLSSIHLLKAQSFTYYHDESKYQQIAVMELGTGYLTPEYYYDIFASGYKKSVNLPTSPKSAQRLLSAASSDPQKAYADSVKLYLEDRAKSELVNLADRQFDAVWLSVEGELSSKVNNVKQGITHLTGLAKQEEIKEWDGLIKQYEYAINVTHKSVMPNYERQLQYMKIIKELEGTNKVLLSRYAYLKNKDRCDKLIGVMSRFKHRVPEESRSSYIRWIENMQTVKTSNKNKGNNQ